MTFTDPIGDMFSRIRNGQQRSLNSVEIPSSNFRKNILEILKNEGYIKDYFIEKKENNKTSLKVSLKYYEGDPVIKEIKRISKPGRRVYSRATSIPRVMNGLGLAILSTPKGVMTMLESIDCQIEGMNCVVIGASNIVGRPMAMELLNARGTVTICNSKTKDLPGKVREADIVVVGVGIPKMVKGDWVKEGAIVIDVGINRLEDGSLVGDVDYDAIKDTAGAITPVPGGVGPMTIATLLENTLIAYKQSL